MQSTDNKAHKKLSPVIWLLLVGIALLLIVAIATPNLLRSRIAADSARDYATQAVAKEPADFRDTLRANVRQVMRTVEMSLLVDDPAKRMEEAAAVASQYRGYVETSQLWHAEGGGSAQVTMRVPAVSLEEARLALRRMGKKVEQEKASANDVTSQMVDLDATLRNYRAEEQQYLAILQRAGTVNDTLAVAQRLSDVRGRIERTQAQQKLLSQQVEMATITVSLRAESISTIQWLPNFREAWRNAAEGMAGYIGAMTALLLYAPVVLAWFATIVLLVAVAWRTLRWVWARWFVQPARA